MKHIFTSVAQAHLATVLLVTISVAAYGCADSATVNPEVELASLTITPGTLQPTFKRSTTQYSVDLTSNITSVTVSAQPAVSGDSVTINGVATTSRVITLGPAGSTTPVSIVVSESGSNSRTYTVLLNRAGLAGNNSLQGLSVSPGTLAPTFDANLLSYTVDVANNVSDVMVTPTLQDPVATVTVDGEPVASGQTQSVSLNGAGSITLINIVVTAQNGTEKTYLITVSRGISSNANLQSLTIVPGSLSPPFSAGEVGYTVNVASNVASVVVTPSLQDASGATMTVNGTPTNSGEARNITLNAAGSAPSNTFINIIVISENQVSQKNYVVVVTRAALGDNNLSTLTITPGSLIPSFTPNGTDYAVNVATNVTEVTITATKAIPNSVMLIGSVTVPAGTASGQETFTLNGPGTPTNITISVTAPNGGTPKTYTVIVNRAASSDNNLSALTVSSGTLDPVFAPGTLPYTVDVATDVTQVNVTATKADPNAILSGSIADPGAGQATGQATIQLDGPGTTTPVTITVTAPNGEFKTYTIDIIRAAPSSDNNLLDLTVTPGILNPLFASGTQNYTVEVAIDVTEVTVAATKSDPDAVMSGDVTAGTGVATGQRTIMLNLLFPTPVSITVIAPNGDPKIYSITITRTLF